MPALSSENRNDLQNYMPQIISSLFEDEEYTFEAFILMKGKELSKNSFSMKVHRKTVITRK